MTGNARNQYLHTQVMTASREQLVLMLYDGALRFCEQAKSAWAANRLEDAHNNMVKAQAIVMELALALDKQSGGIIAANLAKIYTYCYSRLVTANIEKSVKIVDEVKKILGELREAWSAAMAKVEQTQAASPRQTVTVSTAAANAAANPSVFKSQTAQPATPGAVPLARIPLSKKAFPAPQSQEQGSRLSVEG